MKPTQTPIAEHTLDTLMTEARHSWWPSATFLNGLEAKMDAVDATIAAESERIPLDDARRDTSVLFSLDALGELASANDDGEGGALGSGVFFLAEDGPRRTVVGAPGRAIAWALAAIASLWAPPE
ncbi:MAG: hypothetical protein ACI9MR_003779 [Myxococcota bacterium]|jgi:hypothetical protein